MNNDDHKKRVCILGAGPAGLTLGTRLVSSGFEVVIIEKSSQVAGMCKSINLWGVDVDLGPHRFITYEKEVDAYWHKYAGECVKITRDTSILFNSLFFTYPISVSNLIKNFSIYKILRSLGSFLVSFIFRRNTKSSDLESWLIKSYGTYLYNLFFKDYSERLWGRPCKEISSDFAKQRIQGISLVDVIKKVLFPKYQKKTFTQFFDYPKKGTGSVYENMALDFVSNGGEILLEDYLVSIDKNDQRVNGVNTFTGKNIKVDYLFSTMPLTEFFHLMYPDRKNLTQGLSFRSTILVYFKVDGVDLFNENWVYINDPGLIFGRVTNYRNWSKELFKGKEYSIVSVEVWCQEDDGLWNCDRDELVSRCQKDLYRTGLVKEGCIEESKVIPIRNSYPIYSLSYKENVDLLKQDIGQFENVVALGRGGAFRYNNQDQSIFSALKLYDFLKHSENTKTYWAENMSDKYTG